MIDPGAIMPKAPSSPAPSAAKSAAAVDATAEFGAFSELFAALKGETETPDELEPDADTPRDESAGPVLPPVPMQFVPEKTPQARFAEELSATFPPASSQGILAAAPSTTEAEQPEAVEAPKAGIPAASAPVGRPEVRPPMGRDAAGPFSSILPAIAPEPKSATEALAMAPPVLPAGPAPGPQPRSTAKALPQDSSAISGPMATATEPTDPFAAPVPTAGPEDPSRQDSEGGDRERTFAALKEAKLSVVRQETHFAPAPQQSPALQLADRIVREVETADPVFTARRAEVQNDASAAPVKVLHIQLDPPELGALTVRMSLKDNALHLQIDASRQETARLIERDQDRLSGMLRSAGYNFDGLTVQITTGDRGGGAQQFSGGSAFHQPAGQHSTGRQPEDSGSGQAWQGTGEPERRAENGHETEAPGAPVRRGGPVYL